MRSLLLLAAAMTGLSAGCNIWTTQTAKKSAPALLKEKTARKKGTTDLSPDQEAILRVLDADKDKFQATMETLAAEAQPSAVLKAVVIFADHLDTVVATGCPAEFAAARTRYAKSWRQLHAAVARLPDAYPKTEFLDALHALFQGDESRGKGLGGEVIAAVKRVTGTYGEVFTSAEGYGLEVEN